MSSELKKLINQLSDTNPEKRAKAAYHLSEYAERGLTDESVPSRLVKLLEDKNEYVRGNAAAVLSSYAVRELTDKSALPKLVRLLEDRNEDVRGNAAVALSWYAERELTDESAPSKLVKLLKEKSEYLRKNAAAALGWYAERGLVSKESVYSLIELLEDSSKTVRKAAEGALDSVAKHYHVSREELVSNPSQVVRGRTAEEPLEGKTEVSEEDVTQLLKLLNLVKPGSSVTLKMLSAELRVKPQTVNDLLKELASSGRLPGTYDPFEKEFERSGFDLELVNVGVGIGRAADRIKIGIKVTNNSPISLQRVKVTIDPPEGFGCNKPYSELGEIEKSCFKSPNFELIPPKDICAAGNLTGTIMWHDPEGKLYSKTIPPKIIGVVCPFLKPANPDHVKEILQAMSGKGYKYDSENITVETDPETAYNLAVKRIANRAYEATALGERSGLILWKYGCYLCETIYGGYKAAFEVEVAGIPEKSVITLTVYSDEEAIITGMFSEIEQTVREQAEILKDWKKNEVYMCTHCGDLDGYAHQTADENSVVRCESCGAPRRLPRYITGK